MHPDPRVEPDEPIPDTLREATAPPAHATILPPPRPSTGPRTRPSSPSALRVDEILREARRSAGLPDIPPPEPTEGES